MLVHAPLPALFSPLYKNLDDVALPTRRRGWHILFLFPMSSSMAGLRIPTNMRMPTRAPLLSWRIRRPLIFMIRGFRDGGN